MVLQEFVNRYLEVESGLEKGDRKVRFRILKTYDFGL